jgi:3-isopropylmalate/(R)-2-methylmalate dehydratase small subunit
MDAFVTQKGIVATLDRANVDTDQIIPKQFLKSIARTGFGESLFFDWALLPDGSPNPDFELNQPRFKNAKILVARNNFGCGSSREHAVWAVVQAGYTVLIAPSKEQDDGNRVPAFADIFANNAVKNGVLTIELSENDVNSIFDQVAGHEGLEATVDLEAQRITLHSDDGVEIAFDIDAIKKDHLLRGLDDIALSLERVAEIDAFEAIHNVQMAN